MIHDINSLREFAITTLKKLSTGEMTTEEAGVTGKLCENVISTLKVQLEYAKMLGQTPNIGFLEDNTLPEGRIVNAPKKLKSLPKVNNL
jgi:hypothetical protein